MPLLRHLPPAHSPIDAAAALRATLARRPVDPVRRLEAFLADRFGAGEVILCGSGTQALQLALAFAREDTGRDAAALPAYTCYDLVSAAVGAAIRPAFYDLDPDTLLPEHRSLQATLRSDLAALVVVHHFGLPTPIGPLADEAPRGSWVIEDAAQAHGGSFHGRPLGSLAPLSVLSFGRGKGWTGGAGGALLLRGDANGEAGAIRRQLAPAASAAGPAVRLAAQWVLGRPSLYRIPSALPWLGLGETRYVPPSPPRAMAPAVARLALANAAAADREAAIRRRNARRLADRLAAVPGLQVPASPEAPGALRLPVRAPGRAATDLLPHAARRLGIARGYPRPLPTLHAVARLQSEPGDAPGAAILARELFTLPTHSLLRDRDMEHIVALLTALRAGTGSPSGT
jgi:perosamine synthetase